MVVDPAAGGGAIQVAVADLHQRPNRLSTLHTPEEDVHHRVGAARIEAERDAETHAPEPSRAVQRSIGHLDQPRFRTPTCRELELVENRQDP